MIPQPYPLWISPLDRHDPKLVIGWARCGDDADDLYPIVLEVGNVPTQSVISPGEFRVIRPERP